eukprot:gene9448-12732_t
MVIKNIQYFFKQSINWSGITAITDVIKNPSLCIPQIHINKIEDIDEVSLKEKYGIRCVVFDKDNTLCITYSDHLHPSVIHKVEKIKQSFPNSVAILSNSVGTKDDRDYYGAIVTEQNTGLPVIRHLKKKPDCLEEVLKHFNEVFKENIDSTQICMIGDRVLTDVVFANRYGMMSILVNPLSNVKDHPIAVIISLLTKTKRRGSRFCGSRNLNVLILGSLKIIELSALNIDFPSLTLVTSNENGDEL